MSASGDPKVFLILIPVFLAAGIYLIIYNKKKSALFKNFSIKEGLSYQKKDDGEIENYLSEKIKIDEPGYVRTISGVKDIIRYGDMIIFRCTELLDLYKYGSPGNTHFPRVVLSFDAEPGASLFFWFDPKRGAYKSKYPPDKDLENDKYFQAIKTQIKNFPPPHPLTVTLSGGTTFIYMEPLMVGCEKEPDLDYLFDLGKKLHPILEEDFDDLPSDIARAFGAEE